MKKFVLIVFSILFLGLLIPTRSSGQIDVELYAGIGYTGVDIVGWTYINPYDWNQGMGHVYAQAFPLNIGIISIGAEFGFQHFFWYERYNYTEENVDAFRFMGIVRAYLTDKLYTELGPGAYRFGDWTDFGVMGAFGYKIGVTERLSIPIKLRAAIILDEDSNLYPVGLSAGLAYSF